MTKSKGRRLAIVNQKGGTGKTTASVNLSVGLARHKLKTLLIDLDPQHNATLSLGVDPINLPASTYEVLLGEATLEQSLTKTPISSLTLAPAKVDLSNADINLANEPHYQFRLRESLNPIGVDCPLFLELLTVNALVAADSVIIPILCDYLCFRGIKAVNYFD